MGQQRAFSDVNMGIVFKLPPAKTTTVLYLHACSATSAAVAFVVSRDIVAGT